MITNHSEGTFGPLATLSEASAPVNCPLDTVSTPIKVMVRISIHSVQYPSEVGAPASTAPTYHTW